jgi:hypothetical protein
MSQPIHITGDFSILTWWGDGTWVQWCEIWWELRFLIDAGPPHLVLGEKFCPGTVGARQMSPPKGSTLAVGILQGGSRQVGVLQLGFCQLGTLPRGALHVGAREVRAHAGGAPQVGERAGGRV